MKQSKIERYLWLREINRKGYSEYDVEYYALRDDLITLNNGDLRSYWLGKIIGLRVYRPEYKIVNSLKIALYGFYYEAITMYGYVEDVLEFAESKRPWGNKNIPLSILHNTGIDTEDLLEVTYGIPDEVDEFCMDLYEKVLLEIKEDIK
jgi:hypothetical protein